MLTGNKVPPEVTEVTTQLALDLRTILGDRLVGLYLFGSATTGRFEAGISDVDTVAVLASEPTDEDVSALASMHERLVQQAPEWNDRIEVDYLSAQALADFRGRAWPAVRISPGEPFHRIQIDHRWILDWYQLRTSGIAIFGPSPGEVVPPISQAEFVQAVREQLPDWPERVKRNPSAGGLAYAVVTVCRAFRACKTGEYVSKGEAARWAAGELPEFRGVIEDAVEWRYKAGRSTRKPPGPDEARLLSEAVLRLCS